MKKIILTGLILLFVVAAYSQDAMRSAGIRYSKERIMPFSITGADTMTIVASDDIIELVFTVDDASTDSCVFISVTDDIGDQTSSNAVIPPGEAWRIGLQLGVFDTVKLDVRSGAIVRGYSTKIYRNR